MNRTRVLAAVGAAVAISGIAAAPALATVYPPTTPTLVQGICVGDVPYFSYSVDFGENDSFVGQPMTITFVNPGGDDFVINSTVPQPGASQQVLWPGASESPQDWPGWVLDADGQWVESTTDTGAFTRAEGGVTVEFAVNPTISSSVTYPPASAICANPANEVPTTPTSPTTSTTTTTATSGGDTTPATGGNLAPALAGAAALAAGGALVMASRKRRGA